VPKIITIVDNSQRYIKPKQFRFRATISLKAIFGFMLPQVVQWH